MPKILQRQPRWLDHDTPAAEFFFQSSDRQQQKTGGGQKTGYEGASRKIAHRGSEIFYAAGNEIRWSDLAVLKEAGETDGRYGRRPGQSQDQHSAYKVLKSPTTLPIQQLSISPSKDFIAVVTAHTCHVCLLPPREHLEFHDPQHQTLKLRSFTVGPTAHVLEQSPIVSVIWHPLSPDGNGLVTVTKNACVRLWELDQDNRRTFDEPSLAVDLKKLANATSAGEDLSASKYGTNKAYSLDDVEMLVSASCFGGQGKEDEDGWSSMTLWVAMAEGDVYALCPFLPSRFFAPPTLLPSLSTSVVAKKRVLDHERQAPEAERRVANQQSKWLSELDEQDPITLHGTSPVDVYERPHSLSPIAKLQGPFQLTDEPLGEITDIHVVAPRINQEDLFDEEDYDDLAIDGGLSIGIVCLATSTSKVHVCLNVEGVEAEWLPSKRPKTYAYAEDESLRDLLLFETVDFQRSATDAAWTTFTPSPSDRYELFTTQSSGVYSLSFRPWIGSLESELSAPQADARAEKFRMNIIVESSSTTVEQITADTEPSKDMNAAVAVCATESNVGYVVLATVQNRPLAAVLDLPLSAMLHFEPDHYSANTSVLAPEARAPYQPDEIFFQPSKLPAQIEAWRRESATGASVGDIKGGINFSPYTLQKLTEAHRIMSSETFHLGEKAGDLFRHMDRMMSELRANVDKVRELSNRVNSLTGEDEFPEQRPGAPELVRGGRSKIQKRIEQRQDKTREIQDRVERLRKRMRGLGGKELSAKERSFAEEVARINRITEPVERAQNVRLENSTLTTSTEDSDDLDHDNLDVRTKEAKQVYERLLEQAQAAQKELESRTGDRTSSSRPTSGGYRQRKMDEVWGLLERETALVEAVSQRLENLQMGAR